VGEAPERAGTGPSGWEPPDWERSPFMILGPDALARHLVLPVLRRLADAGFEPVAYRVLWARPDELDEFNARNIRGVFDAYLYRMVDLLFAFGPSVAMVVRDTGEGQDSHERLRALKGASDPHDAEPGTIRRDYAATNAVVSVVHSSDTVQDSIRECGVFCSPRGPIPLPNGPAELASVASLVQAAMPRETRGFDQVLGGLRARIGASLWDELRPSGRALLAEWTDPEPSAPGTLERFAAVGAGRRLAESLHAGMEHPLAPVLAAEFQPGWPALDMQRVRHLLAAHQVPFDRWDDLVLSSSTWFRPFRPSLSTEGRPKLRELRVRRPAAWAPA
jgi:nucleoside diphosphate kinase